MSHRIEQLEKFLKITPEDPFLYHALALEYLKKEDWSKADAYFSHNLNNHGDYIPTYYHLAVLYLNQGREEEASDLLEKGLMIAKSAGDDHAYREMKSLWEEVFL